MKTTPASKFVPRGQSRVQQPEEDDEDECGFQFEIRKDRRSHDEWDQSHTPREHLLDTTGLRVGLYSESYEKKKERRKVRQLDAAIDRIQSMARWYI